MQSEARFGRHELGLYAATVAAWSLSWYALSINMATGIPAPVSTTWRFGMASAIMFVLASIVNLGIAAVRGDRAGPRRWFGATLGVCGVAMLYGRELLGDASALVGLAFCVSGTLSFCLGNLVSQSLQGQSVPVLSASAWGMLYGMVWSAVLVVAFGYEFQFDWSFSYVGSMIFLVLVSTILAFWAYLNLIGRIGAGRAAYATVTTR